MDKKKKIAIILGAVWLVLIVGRLVLTPGDSLDTGRQTLSMKAAPRGTAGQDTVSYPPLKFSLVRKDLFAELAFSRADKREDAESKKMVAMPAPPLPLLPDEPKLKKDDKSEEAADSLKDITLLGVMHKNDKKLTFLKKGKDVKAFGIGEAVFNSAFFVEKIEADMIVLKNNSGQKITLELWFMCVLRFWRQAFFPARRTGRSKRQRI
jgi:hypothetical protein